MSTDVRPGQLWRWTNDTDRDEWFVVLVISELLVDGPTYPMDWNESERSTARFYKTRVIWSHAGLDVNSDLENYWPDVNCWELISDA